jgi:hypothetical protein
MYSAGLAIPVPLGFRNHLANRHACSSAANGLRITPRIIASGAFCAFAAAHDAAFPAR